MLHAKESISPGRRRGSLWMVLFVVLAFCLTCLTGPTLGYATGYDDVAVTALVRNEQNLITSVTISFVSGNTYQSSWCLAVYDREVPYESGLTNSGAIGNIGAAVLLAQSPVSDSSDGTHSLTLTSAQGFADTNYLCMLIYYAGRWVRDLPDYGIPLSLKDLVDEYEEELQLALTLVDGQDQPYTSATYSGSDLPPNSCTSPRVS